MLERGRPRIPFNRPYLAAGEAAAIVDVHERGHTAGDGSFTRRCHEWLESTTGAERALLTTSGTGALELAGLLLELEPGDEIIMPSFTFVSTANAFVLRGAVPVFVDVRADTLNIDEALIEQAITSATRAICVVHYAGVPAEMDTILGIAARHDLRVVEDAAQAVMSTYRGRPVGTLGDLGTLSFHETKNLTSGEGGALLCRDGTYVERAEILRHKGTNRSQFERGEVAKYTWVDVGSSFLPSEVTAAILLAQMLEAETITAQRMALWNRYDSWAAEYAELGLLERPTIPPGCGHNAHMYYVLLRSGVERDAFIAAMAARGIESPFHYVPLHSSPAGTRYGRVVGPMTTTDSVSGRLVRMPLWLGLETQLDEVLEVAGGALRSGSERS